MPESLSFGVEDCFILQADFGVQARVFRAFSKLGIQLFTGFVVTAMRLVA